MLLSFVGPWNLQRVCHGEELMTQDIIILILSMSVAPSFTSYHLSLSARCYICSLMASVLFNHNHLHLHLRPDYISYLCLRAFPQTDYQLLLRKHPFIHTESKINGRKCISIRMKLQRYVLSVTEVVVILCNSLTQVCSPLLQNVTNCLAGYRPLYCL